jgi:hypothetical protein
MGKHKKRRNKKNKGNNRPSQEVQLPLQPAPHQTTNQQIVKQPWFWSIVSFFVALGFPLVLPTTDSPIVVYSGWVLWSFPAALFLIGLWQHLGSPWWTKIILTLAVAALFSWAAHRNIIQRLKPSFAFIVPGVVLNGDTWDFIANHRGSKSSSNVQVLFIDEDRKNFVTHSQTSITPADINSYQVLWSLPEVNPIGRGSIFAQQLLWKPFNLEHSHFTAEITWRDGSVHEELQIARVNEAWQYAMRISDRETGKNFVWCRDKDFPSSDTLPVCFPQMTQPSE